MDATPDPHDVLLAEHAASIDAAVGRLFAQSEATGLFVTPRFDGFWRCFQDWFQEPVAGIDPSGDSYEFSVGFIDGDPERASMELEVPASLAAPLVEVALVRSWTVRLPGEDCSQLGLGRAWACFHYELTDAWRTLPAYEGRYWENRNPCGWVNFGEHTTARASLDFTAATRPFRLAADHPPLRFELAGSTREDAVVVLLGDGPA